MVDVMLLTDEPTDPLTQNIYEYLFSALGRPET
jgi:hypothetical protein